MADPHVLAQFSWVGTLVPTFFPPKNLKREKKKKKASVVDKQKLNRRNHYKAGQKEIGTPPRMNSEEKKGKKRKIHSNPNSWGEKGGPMELPKSSTIKRQTRGGVPRKNLWWVFGWLF